VFADIFRAWDYTSGIGFSIITSLLLGWIGVFFVLLFWLSTISGLLPTRVEARVLKVVNVCSNLYERKGNSKTDPATAGFFTALYVTLLFFNIRGHLPGFYRISREIFMIVNIAIAIVLAGHLMYFSPQWFNYFSIFVKDLIQYRSIAIVVAIADLIRIIRRPIILAVRLFINIIVGQLVIRSVYATLQPAILKAIYIRVLLKALICTGLSFWEIGVGIFQATLFVYLCLVYRGDGSYQR